MGIRTHFLDTQMETWSFYLNHLPKIVISLYNLTPKGLSWDNLLTWNSGMSTRDIVFAYLQIAW